MACRDHRAPLGFGSCLFGGTGARRDHTMAKESPRRLLEACGRGDAAQVQTILSGSRVDVNADERGWTPAYVAAQNGHTAVLKALIGAGCDVNASREDGAAPALIAAEKGHGETLEALVAAGCDVDHANGEGWTPALFAAQENQTEALGVLLRAGCDVDNRAGKECEIPNFKGSYLCRFPLVLADYWTSDHLLERPRSVDAFGGTRTREYSRLSEV